MNIVAIINKVRYSFDGVKNLISYHNARNKIGETMQSEIAKILKVHKNNESETSSDTVEEQKCDHDE